MLRIFSDLALWYAVAAGWQPDSKGIIQNKNILEPWCNAAYFHI
jgi:hypothetical protein